MSFPIQRLVQGCYLTPDKYLCLKVNNEKVYRVFLDNKEILNTLSEYEARNRYLLILNAHKKKG